MSSRREAAEVIRGRRRWPVARLRMYLAGAWRIHRSITDHRLNLMGVFVGIARFTPVDDNLRCREVGTLSLGAYQGAAHRELSFVFRDDACADVLFADGRPFHALDLRNGIDRVVHHCGTDTYHGHFEALDAETLCVDWTVTGARKHQQLSAYYRRIDPGATEPDA